jgi:hypothetical protein
MQESLLHLPWPPWAARQEIEMILSVAPPKVAKTSTVTCRWRWHYHANLYQWKQGCKGECLG